MYKFLKKEQNSVSLTVKSLIEELQKNTGLGAKLLSTDLVVRSFTIKEFT
ncbi:hypothetical protein SAMN02745163_01348 [Clostridium cavendishii DSM 21758]|uniref:Uncharacterized protein n=1 Tax=Clostridium cavendishii DSM 21758 TaxID=1121302 RepID=A0A1M6GPY6_9CLOT|nr:hypothetical protein [Clostridium cavendishii]SHJ12024.1 hypothetical protein SAMN02745163_01348 [Clostridium cavendishii DSM 21758]